MQFIDRGERPSPAWVSEARDLLQRVAGPDLTVARHMEQYGSWPAPGTWWDDEKTQLKQAELELMIVPGIRRLVERATEP